MVGEIKTRTNGARNIVFMDKKVKTTFDKWMADPKIKEHFKKGYENLLLSEIILKLMEKRINRNNRRYT